MEIPSSIYLKLGVKYNIEISGECEHGGSFELWSGSCIFRAASHKFHTYIEFIPTASSRFEATGVKINMLDITDEYGLKIDIYSSQPSVPHSTSKKSNVRVIIKHHNRQPELIEPEVEVEPESVPESKPIKPIKPKRASASHKPSSKISIEYSSSVKSILRKKSSLPWVMMYCHDVDLLHRLSLFHKISTKFQTNVLHIIGPKDKKYTEATLQLKKDYPAIDVFNYVRQNIFMKDDIQGITEFSLESSTNQLLTALKTNRGIITQVAISNSLSKFSDKIRQEYGFCDYLSKHKPTIFFGCYNRSDFETIKAHKNKTYVMWGGTDVLMMENTDMLDFFRGRNVHHIAISQQIADRLNNNGIANVTQIHLRLLNYWDYPEPAVLGDAVYIYTALDPKRADQIYGSSIYKEVIRRLPDIKFIIAHGQYTKSQIIDVYHKCFIGLRLTKFDGNANTVQELGMLGINCVHNGEFPNSLGWSTVDDVVRLIQIERQKIGTIQQNVRDQMLSYLDTSYDWLFDFS